MIYIVLDKAKHVRFRELSKGFAERKAQELSQSEGYACLVSRNIDGWEEYTHLHRA